MADLRILSGDIFEGRAFADHCEPQHRDIYVSLSHDRHEGAIKGASYILKCNDTVELTSSEPF